MMCKALISYVIRISYHLAARKRKIFNDLNRQILTVPFCHTASSMKKAAFKNFDRNSIERCRETGIRNGPELTPVHSLLPFEDFDISEVP